MIYERALEERERLETELEKLKIEVKNYPKGKLICSHSGKYPKNYVSYGNKRKYINSKNHELAEALAAKKYINTLIEDYTHEIMALNYYINHHKTHVNHTEKLLSLESKYQPLLAPYFKPISKELDEWMHADYERNTQYPQNLIHTGLSGNLVRSKAEAMIDMLLTKHHIPFRYECKLNLGDISYYPDFTIRHPITGMIYYWEHFGKMNDPMYCNTVNSKLHTYIRHEIIPTINLITTYEYPNHPLTSDYILTLINYYFC